MLTKVLPWRAASGLTVLWICLAGAGCSSDSKPEQVLQTRLFKQARPPVELASGDLLQEGDELYMTVMTDRPLHMYVVSEDMTGERWLIHPCRAEEKRRPFAAGRLYRLPQPLLGREVFWPVQTATLRERVLVLASDRPIDALEAVMIAAEGLQPCTAILDTEAHRWIDGLTARIREPGGSPEDSRRRLWEIDSGSEQVWISAYDLEGNPGPGSHE